LYSQISIVNPKVIIAAGSTAVYSILGLKDPISKIRGMKFSFSLPEEIGTRFVVPTFHPSYMLYYRSSTDIVASDIKFSLTLLE
jgi:DNA polymerase